jgi:hypothetical protein
MKLILVRQYERFFAAIPLDVTIFRNVSQFAWD